MNKKSMIILGIGLLVVAVGITFWKIPLRTREVSFVVSSNRYLEIEPCGCSITPLGGLEREWNLLERLKNESKGELISLVTGTSFLPEPKAYKDSLKATYLRKGSFLIEGLSKMGIRVLAPSMDDFAIGGSGYLKELASKASFPFLTTNLLDVQSDAPIFKTHVVLSVRGDKLLVVSAMGDTSEYGMSPMVKVADPIESIRKVLAELSEKDAKVIVLTNLSQSAQRRLLEAIPEVSFSWGGQVSEKSSGVSQWSSSVITANPDGQGKALARISFKSPAGIQSPFYGKSSQSSLMALREFWNGNINSAASEESKIFSQKELDRLNTIPTDPQVAKSVFEAEVMVLDDRFDLPKNPMSDLIERYKELQREIAIGEKTPN